MHNDETLSTTAGPATSNINMTTSVNSCCCMLNYRQRHGVHLSFQTTKTTKSKHKNTISCSIKIIRLNFLITLKHTKQDLPVAFTSMGPFIRFNWRNAQTGVLTYAKSCRAWMETLYSEGYVFNLHPLNIPNKKN